MFNIDNFWLDIRYWMGVNGRQELNLEKKFKSIDTRIMAHYYMDQNRALAVIDKRLTRQWSLRFTHDRTFEGEIEEGGAMVPTLNREENKAQIRFSLRF